MSRLHTLLPNMEPRTGEIQFQLVPVRVEVLNRRPQNNALERTRSRANGLAGPCRSMRCCAD